MGMLATVMNALAMQDALKRRGLRPRHVGDADPRGLRGLHPAPCDAPPGEGPGGHLAAGTGNPFFTTDTAASLRAIEIDADVLLKATKVDGVYTADPKNDPDAERYDTLSFDKVLADKLSGHGRDRDRHVPRQRPAAAGLRPDTAANALVQAMTGDDVGTLVTA